MNIEKEREAFEKSYAEMLIGEELKGLESVIFAKYLESGEYAQDKVDTAWCMWQAAKAQAVPEGFVLVSKDKLHEWKCMARRSEELGCPDCYESRGYSHNLAEEIEAQEQNQ